MAHLKDDVNIVTSDTEGSVQQPPHEYVDKDESGPDVGTKFKLTLEPLMILLYIGLNINIMVQTNLFEERMCLHTDFGRNKSVDCFNMTADEQEIIQPAVANLQMSKSIIETLIPCVTALFLGPWSDVNGRLPLLLTAISGLVISNCMYCTFSTIPELPPIMFLLCSLPVAISGGSGVIYIAYFCYIVDITDQRTRAFRISVLQAFNSIGSIIGSLLSPLLYSKSSTYAFSVSSIFIIVGLLYTSIFLKETVVIKQDTNTKLFNINLLKDMSRTIMEQRFGFLRCIIILSSVALSLNLVVLIGEHSISYMYLQKQFSWTLENFTLLRVYQTLLNASIPPIFLFVLSTKKQIHDMYLVIVASGLCIIEKIGFAYSVFTWQFYTSNIFGCFGLACQPLIRSQLSKLFPLDDLGKIYTFITILENIGVLLSYPIYTTAYNTTIHNFANFIFILSFIISTFIFVLYILIAFLISKSNQNITRLVD